MKQLFFISIFIGLALAANGQKKPAAKATAPAAGKPEYIYGKLGLKTKGYDNKMVLRWAINNPAAWVSLQQSGVNIDRAVLDERNQHTTKSWVRVNKQPVRPWTAEQFKKPGLLTKANNNLLIVAQALYGEQATKVSSQKINTDSIVMAGLEFENKFTMALMAADAWPQAADALGFRYEDTIAVNTRYKYAYRVYAAVSHQLFKIDTAYYLYSGLLKGKHTAPTGVTARGKDGKIELHWPKKDVQNHFTSYNIERSADGKTFSRLNKLPLMFSRSDTASKDFIYADKIENYKKYYYRMNGIDAFGDTSYYCATVWAIGRNLNAPPSAYLSAQTDKKGNVSLRWKQTEAQGRPVSGFVIRRGRTLGVLDETVHDQVLPKNTLTFTDKPGKLDKGVYYQVISIDTAGNYSFSNIPYVFANDTIAPKVPAGLAGVIDSLGNVKITWNHDYQDNVSAYRLFVSNNPNATFSPVSAALIRDTVYNDKVSSTLLNRKIYYKVVAIDGNNNHSPLSAPAELLRPRMVASPAPVIGNFKVLQSSVQFEFSVLADNSMAQINILRRVASTPTWGQIAKLPVAARLYKDSTVIPGTRYKYVVQTLNSDKSLSKQSLPLNVLVYAAQAEAPLALVLRTDKSTAQLNWQAPRQPVQFFIIYKDTGQGFVQYQSVDGSALTFKEPNSGKVRYGIKAVYAGQRTSEVKESNWSSVSQ